MSKEIISDMKDKNVLIVGTGKSGKAAAQAMVKLGAHVSIQDNKLEDEVDSQLEAYLEDKNINCYWACQPEDMTQFDLLILSPGVPPGLPFIEEAKAAGAEIIGELEIAYRVGHGRYVAITGTNGKTTTTTLVGEIFKAAARQTYVVGNIGVAVISKALSAEKDSWLITETSSFQLETIRDFRPEISAILNLTPDHLDRHKTMECYIETKESITKNQKEGDVCVLNYEEPVLREFGETLKDIKVVYFSSLRTLKQGFYLKEDEIVYNDGEKETVIVNIHDLKLLGRHNHENVMAAVAISMNMGVPLEKIQKVIKEFKAVEHRIEFVTERFGVKYYNDSKGTNPDAAIQGIKAMSKPTVLIGGGYDKQSEYDEWIESFDGKVKCLVLIGQTREKIAECARKHGFDKIRFADTYEECLKLCTELAEPGDAVLLSPACASWGMFPNYEVRGQLFKEYVHGLAE